MRELRRRNADRERDGRPPGHPRALTAVDVPLDRIHIAGDHLPGPMDLRHVLALLDGSYIDDRPLDVQADGDRAGIRNGRHRYVAALLRGDTSYRCTFR